MMTQYSCLSHDVFRAEYDYICSLNDNWGSECIGPKPSPTMLHNLLVLLQKIYDCGFTIAPTIFADPYSTDIDVTWDEMWVTLMDNDKITITTLDKNYSTNPTEHMNTSFNEALDFIQNNWPHEEYIIPK
jgi:hypothetical protein